MDLESYKQAKGLCNQEIVNEVEKAFPKFDLPLELAVCDPKTGVALEGAALAMLTMKYGPVPKRKEHRRKESRCTARLTRGQARLFRKALTDNGMTVQGLLYNAIDAFMRVAAPEAWKKESARTAATVPSAGK